MSTRKPTYSRPSVHTGYQMPAKVTAPTKVHPIHDPTMTQLQSTPLANPKQKAVKLEIEDNDDDIICIVSTVKRT